MDQPTRLFIDTSKSVFQLHGVNQAEAVVLRRQLPRSRMLEFFGKLPATVIGIEACGGAHHWARVLGELGHEVKLIAPQLVKPYVKRGKNDAADAEAGCEAMSRPTMRFVPVKSCDQQAALMLAGVREAVVRERTQLTNMIRGYAAEFGVVAPKGLCAVEPLLRKIAEEPSHPTLMRELFAGLGEQYEQVQVRFKAIDAKLLAWHRASPLSRALAKIPGVGPIGASLLVMKTPDPKAFKSGRQYAAWLGLTPKDHSTAGKARPGVITRAGDETLRSVLVVGATSVVKMAKLNRGVGASPWLVELLKRKAPKLAAVALANKIARIAWCMMATGELYDAKRMKAAPAATPAAA
jgi:transposase